MKDAGWRSVVAGALGGLVATTVMTGAQMAFSKLAERYQSREESGASGEGESATVKTAEAMVETTTGEDLAEEHKPAAGQMVHFGFGVTMGALYGLIADLNPAARAGYGVAYGAGLWAMADEVAIPLLGLSKSPQEYPLSTHVSALAAHMVYGATLDAATKQIRERL